MSETRSNMKKYLIIMTFGAVAGGAFTAYVTKAMPKIMSEMMRNMMSEMRSEGCSLSEI